MARTADLTGAMLRRQTMAALLKARARIELSCTSWNDVSFVNPFEGFHFGGTAPELRTWKGFLVTPLAVVLLAALLVLWPISFVSFQFDLLRKRIWVWRHVWRRKPPTVERRITLGELWDAVGPHTQGLPEEARHAVLKAWAEILYPGVEINPWFERRLFEIREPYRKSRADHIAGRTGVVFFSSQSGTFDDAVQALSEHLGPPKELQDNVHE